MSQGPPVPAFSPTMRAVFDASNGAAPAGTPLNPGNVFSPGKVFSAKADDTPSTYVVGIALFDCVDGELCTYQYSGPVKLSTEAWDVVLGNNVPAGLNPGAQYYLSDSINGRLTEIAPTDPGSYVAPVGVALTSQILLLQSTAPTIIS